MISPDDLDYFRTDISKDQVRHGMTPGPAGHVFLKRTPSPAHARREHDTLCRLFAAGGEPLVPEPLGVAGSDVVLGLTDGIRLFELLRMLRSLATAPEDPLLAQRATDARDVLLARCLEREQRIQTVLRTDPEAVRIPYPFDQKIRRLLDHLARLCDLPPADARLRRELDLLAELWSAAACVPFRDATPKNILIADPDLAIRAGRDPAARMARLRDRLASGAPDDWRRIPILDVDFTSVEHLTAPEDDAISLLGHQISHEGPAVATLAAIGRRAPQRTALGLLVRYLRFGGRKLSYRILNPTGFRVRFRHDDPAFYFTSLPGRIAGLSPAFAARFPATLARCRRIGEVAVRLGPPAPDEPDFYLGWSNLPPSYWQESPLEGHPP